MNPLISERMLKAGITPIIINLVLTDANTEYTLALPSGCVKFSFKTRNSAHDLKFSFTQGESGTNYVTLDDGAGYSEDNVLSLNKSIYLQSPNAGAVVELIAWS